MPSELELHVHGSSGAAQALWHLSPHLLLRPFQGDVVLVHPWGGCSQRCSVWAPVWAAQPRLESMLCPHGTWPSSPHARGLKGTQRPTCPVAVSAWVRGNLLVGQHFADTQGPLGVGGFGPKDVYRRAVSVACCVQGVWRVTVFLTSHGIARAETDSS